MKLQGTFASVVLLLLLSVASRSFGVTITNVSPPLGSVGDPIIIRGAGGFAPGGNPPASLVVKFFNNVIATTDPSDAVTDFQINTFVPAGATSGKVTVQINGGPIAQSPQDFTVINNGPYVTNFTPVFGGSDASVTLTGVHFSTVTNISFNGKLGVNINTSAQDVIIIQAPAGV